MEESLVQIQRKAAVRTRHSEDVVREQAANELFFAVVGHVGSGTTEVAKLRHPAEVHLLRSVYQTAFTLIGVVCDDEDERIKRLGKKYADAGDQNARDFMDRDASAPEKHGQRVADAFHLADVFIDNSEDRAANADGRRFLATTAPVTWWRPVLTRFSTSSRIPRASPGCCTRMRSRTARRAGNLRARETRSNEYYFVPLPVWLHACIVGYSSRIEIRRTRRLARCGSVSQPGRTRGTSDGRAMSISKPSYPAPSTRSAMDKPRDHSPLRLVTASASSPAGVSGPAGVSKDTRRKPPQLELVSETTGKADTRTRGVQLRLFSDVANSGPSLLGFFHMHCALGESFAGLIEQVRPVWLFDLRPVASFNLLRLDRRRAFRWFTQHGTTYCDLNAQLGLWERDDPRIASGELAEELNRFTDRPDRPGMKGPIVFLVDDRDVISLGAAVFPRALHPKPPGGWQVHVFDHQALQHI